jgi:K+-transporting ATPase c subunit
VLAVKAFVVFAMFIWLLCGFIGAWWLEGLGDMHFKTIARGPISLVKAFNENPVTYPGPS